MTSVEDQVSEKILFEAVDAVCEKHLSDEALGVYKLLKKGSTVDEVALDLDISHNAVLNARKEIRNLWESDTMQVFREEFAL
jgi:DNA-binding NarL/FixJ family response regulator